MSAVYAGTDRLVKEGSIAQSNLRSASAEVVIDSVNAMDVDNDAGNANSVADNGNDPMLTVGVNKDKHEHELRYTPPPSSAAATTSITTAAATPPPTSATITTTRASSRLHSAAKWGASSGNTESGSEAVVGPNTNINTRVNADDTLKTKTDTTSSSKNKNQSGSPSRPRTRTSVTAATVTPLRNGSMITIASSLSTPLAVPINSFTGPRTTTEVTIGQGVGRSASARTDIISQPQTSPLSKSTPSSKQKRAPKLQKGKSKRSATVSSDEDDEPEEEEERHASGSGRATLSNIPFRVIRPPSPSTSLQTITTNMVMESDIPPLPVPSDSGSYSESGAEMQVDNIPPSPLSSLSAVVDVNDTNAEVQTETSRTGKAKGKSTRAKGKQRAHSSSTASVISVPVSVVENGDRASVGGSGSAAGSKAGSVNGNGDAVIPKATSRRGRGRGGRPRGSRGGRGAATARSAATASTSSSKDEPTSTSTPNTPTRAPTPPYLRPIPSPPWEKSSSSTNRASVSLSTSISMYASVSGSGSGSGSGSAPSRMYASYPPAPSISQTMDRSALPSSQQGQGHLQCQQKQPQQYPHAQQQQAQLQPPVEIAIEDGGAGQAKMKGYPRTRPSSKAKGKASSNKSTTEEVGQQVQEDGHVRQRLGSLYEHILESPTRRSGSVAQAQDQPRTQSNPGTTGTLNLSYIYPQLPSSEPQPQGHAYTHSQPHTHTQVPTQASTRIPTSPHEYDARHALYATYHRSRGSVDGQVHGQGHPQMQGHPQASPGQVYAQPQPPPGHVYPPPPPPGQVQLQPAYAVVYMPPPQQVYYPPQAPVVYSHPQVIHGQPPPPHAYPNPPPHQHPHSHAPLPAAYPNPHQPGPSHPIPHPNQPQYPHPNAQPTAAPTTSRMQVKQERARSPVLSSMSPSTGDDMGVGNRGRRKRARSRSRVGESEGRRTGERMEKRGDIVDVDGESESKPDNNTNVSQAPRPRERGSRSDEDRDVKDDKDKVRGRSTGRRQRTRSEDWVGSLAGPTATRVKTEMKSEMRVERGMHGLDFQWGREVHGAQYGYPPTQPPPPLLQHHRIPEPNGPPPPPPPRTHPRLYRPYDYVSPPPTPPQHAQQYPDQHQHQYSTHPSQHQNHQQHQHQQQPSQHPNPTHHHPNPAHYPQYSQHPQPHHQYPTHPQHEQHNREEQPIRDAQDAPAYRAVQARREMEIEARRQADNERHALRQRGFTRADMEKEMQANAKRLALVEAQALEDEQTRRDARERRNVQVMRDAKAMSEAQMMRNATGPSSSGQVQPHGHKSSRSGSGMSGAVGLRPGISMSMREGGDGGTQDVVASPSGDGLQRRASGAGSGTEEARRAVEIVERRRESERERERERGGVKTRVEVDMDVDRFEGASALGGPVNIDLSRRKNLSASANARTKGVRQQLRTTTTDVRMGSPNYSLSLSPSHTPIVPSQAPVSHLPGDLFPSADIMHSPSPSPRMMHSAPPPPTMYPRMVLRPQPTMLNTAHYQQHPEPPPQPMQTPTPLVEQPNSYYAHMDVGLMGPPSGGDQYRHYRIRVTEDGEADVGANADGIDKPGVTVEEAERRTNEQRSKAERLQRMEADAKHVVGERAETAPQSGQYSRRDDVERRASRAGSDWERERDEDGRGREVRGAQREHERRREGRDREHSGAREQRQEAQLLSDGRQQLTVRTPDTSTSRRVSRGSYSPNPAPEQPRQPRYQQHSPQQTHQSQTAYPTAPIQGPIPYLPPQPPATPQEQDVGGAQIVLRPERQTTYGSKNTGFTSFRSSDFAILGGGLLEGVNGFGLGIGRRRGGVLGSLAPTPTAAAVTGIGGANGGVMVFDNNVTIVGNDGAAMGMIDMGMRPLPPPPKVKRPRKARQPSGTTTGSGIINAIDVDAEHAVTATPTPKKTRTTVRKSTTRATLERKVAVEIVAAAPPDLSATASPSAISTSPAGGRPVIDSTILDHHVPLAMPPSSSTEHIHIEAAGDIVPNPNPNHIPIPIPFIATLTATEDNHSYHPSSSNSRGKFDGVVKVEVMDIGLGLDGGDDDEEDDDELGEDDVDTQEEDELEDELGDDVDELADDDDSDMNVAGVGVGPSRGDSKNAVNSTRPTTSDDSSSGFSSAAMNTTSAADANSDPSTANTNTVYPSRKDNRYACDVCGQVFTRSGDVRRHKDSRHTDGSSGCRCRYCGRVLTRQDALQRHWDKYCRKKSMRHVQRSRNEMSVYGSTSNDNSQSHHLQHPIDTTTNGADARGTRLSFIDGLGSDSRLKDRPSCSRSRSHGSRSRSGSADSGTSSAYGRSVPGGEEEYGEHWDDDDDGSEVGQNVDMDVEPADAEVDLDYGKPAESEVGMVGVE